MSKKVPSISPSGVGATEITDGNQVVEIDQDSQGIVSIDVGHSNAHEEKVFSICGQDSRETGQVAGLLLRNTSLTKESHLGLTIVSTAQVDAQVYKSPVTSVTGMDISTRIQNSNMRSTNTSEMVAYVLPTCSSTGNLFRQVQWLNGKSPIVIEAGSKTEIILNSGAEILLKMTSKAAGCTISWMANWYETKRETAI